MNEIPNNIDNEWASESDPDRLMTALKLAATGTNGNLDALAALASEGSRLGQMYYGDALIYGRNIEKDIDVGIKYLKQSANAGSIEGAFSLARYYESICSFDQAIATYEKLAELQYSPAMYMLGTIYYKGEGVPKNLDTAISWWKFADNRGHLIARHWLIWVYRHEKRTLKYHILALIKQLTGILPFVRLKIKDPDSDRLRNQ